MQDGYTALHIACSCGHNEIVQELLLAPDMDIGAADKASPRHFISTPNLHSAQIVKQMYIRIRDSRMAGRRFTVRPTCLVCAITGDCILHVATARSIIAVHCLRAGGHLDAVRLLLTKSDAEVNAKDRVRAVHLCLPLCVRLLCMTFWRRLSLYGATFAEWAHGVVRRQRCWQ